MPVEVDRDLAGRVRLAIELAGGNLSEVARRAGLAPKTLTRYSKTVRGNPSLATLIDIADATAVDFEWLATGRGVPRPDKNSSADDAMLPSEQFIRSAWRQVEIALEESGQKKALPWSGDTMVQMLRLGFEAALRVMEVAPATAHERLEKASRLWTRPKAKERADK